MDRVATHNKTLEKPSFLCIHKLHNLLYCTICKSSSERLHAMWMLFDKDDDTLLDAEEMELVVRFSIDIVASTLREFVDEAINAGSILETIKPIDNNRNLLLQKIQQYSNWKKIRNESRSLDMIRTKLGRTLRHHFEFEIELPHRLRCVYAWANKKHQDGKVQNVIIENTSDEGDTSLPRELFTGKMKYVELDPKVSYQEFIESQRKYLPHLDQIGEEFCTSFKEDLWLKQGKERQNTKLRKDAVIFLIVIVFCDIFISMA